MATNEPASYEEVKKAMAFVTSIVGLSALEVRWADLDRQRRSPARSAHASHVFALELAHFDEMNTGAMELGWPSHAGNPPLHRLYAFAVAFRRLHAKLGERAKTRLSGSLRRHYLQDVGLRPMVYEMLILQHLVRMGFRIDAHDLEQEGGFDYLATDVDGTEVEVECKHLSADIGRKVHRNEACTLLELLEPVIAERVASLDGSVILTVEVARQARR